MNRLRNLKSIMLFILKRQPWYLFYIILSAVVTSGAAYYPVLVFDRWIVNIITSDQQNHIYSMAASVIFLAAIMEFWKLIINRIDVRFAILRKRHKERTADEYSRELFQKIVSMRGDCLEDARVYELYVKCRSKCIPKMLDAPVKTARIVMNVISIILYAEILRQVNVYFFLIVITAAVIKHFILLKRKKRRYKYDELINGYNIKLDAYSEMISDKSFMAEIKVYDSLDFINRKRKALYNDMRSEFRKMACFDMLHSFISFLVDKGVYFGSYIYLALKRLDGVLSMGDFSCGIGAIRQFEASISKVFSGVGDIMGDFCYYDDYFKFMNESPAQRGGEKLPSARSLRLENVGYTYLSNDSAALKNISCEFRPGMKVCIAGRNGAGKSTLAKVIGGIYEMYEGDIFFDDRNMKSYSVSSVTEQIDICPQNFARYPFSLKYNIDFGREDDGRLSDAVSASGVGDFVGGLPEREETLLDAKYSKSGVDLSGGQWQRILIARILYADRNIVIFDEPTSSLDPLIENQIFSEILKMRDRLVIVISHRMSCAGKMDRIIVLDDGQIVETGTHSELMERKGCYYEMFTMQADRYDAEI